MDVIWTVHDRRRGGLSLRRQVIHRGSRLRSAVTVFVTQHDAVVIVYLLLLDLLLRPDRLCRRTLLTSCACLDCSRSPASTLLLWLLDFGFLMITALDNIIR